MLSSAYKISKSKDKLSPEVDWLEKEGGKEHHVNMIFYNNDPLNKSVMTEQHKILVEWIEKFHRYFREKVKEN